MNKLLISGLLIFVSITVFYTFSKETIIQKTDTTNNISTSELSYQGKKVILKKNEIAVKTADISLQKDSIPKNILKIKKQARLEDDKKFLDKEKLILNDSAILDRMTEDNRDEYYKEKELKDVVRNEIANIDGATNISYDEAILSKMTKDEENEYYDRKELKNMNVQEIDNNYAVDIPLEVLNPPNSGS